MAQAATQGTPAAAPEQAARSVEDRLVNFLGQPEAEPAAADDDAGEADAAPATEAQAPDGQAPDGELSPEDIPDDAAPAAKPDDGEVFEFDAAGERLKLPRTEVIKLAQQGHDYTRKTMALAEQAKAVQERLARVTAIEQVAPQLQAAQSHVQALGAQLQQFGQFVEKQGGWVALATNDPFEYSKMRAQYDVLSQQYQGAHGQYQQIDQAVRQQTAALRAQTLQREVVVLTERLPEWKDPEKYKAAVPVLRDYLLAEGATAEEINGLTSSLAVAIAEKARRYDALVKAKNAKVGKLQSLPPVTRPGAAPNRDAARADKETALRTNLKKTGSVEDAAALLMTRMK